ncbi:mitochondrial import inner membrane translocase subunit Tim22 [Strongylocentrotus purpuratus]|uniref:Mitochondrial import inner membrane translocase subunit TIM22 n=1 Tax=Strongylocentrotus purpuratus TaxID=7668 RepID=A0A7M7T228_STRPU|nr:mitochondrial import inner membrane translocase subunit Tim22 [Strongylocentrotus purpuratus]
MAAPSGQTHEEGGVGLVENESDPGDLRLLHVMEALVGENKKRFSTEMRQFGLPLPPKSPEEQTIERVMESCTFKTVISGVLGFALGGAIGLFASSVNPVDPELAAKQKARDVLKDMGKQCLFHAKNFAMIGAMFACTECLVESYRGKHDAKNSPIAGCITGGLIGYRAGLKPGVAGCVGFAAFSAAIDRYFSFH